MQNGFVESLNGRLRDECLNENLFRGLHAARQIIEAWRIDYNPSPTPYETTWSHRTRSTQGHTEKRVQLSARA
jgi:transposase InsO family protein